MEMRRMSCVVFSLVVALGAGSCLAQEAVAGESVSPYTDDYVKERIRENTISGQPDKALIPDNRYFLLIFREILVNPPEYVSEADLEVIKNLPSHMDVRFFSENAEALEGICRDARSVASDDDVLSIGIRMDAARKQKDLLLDANYRKALSLLSEDARKGVMGAYIELRDSDRVGYSVMNMSGVARDLPKLFGSLADSGCHSVSTLLENQRRLQGDRGFLLVDELATEVKTSMEHSNLQRD